MAIYDLTINVRVLGNAPALALANLYQATAQALANVAHNATFAQRVSETMAGRQ